MRSSDGYRTDTFAPYVKVYHLPCDLIVIQDLFAGTNLRRHRQRLRSLSKAMFAAAVLVANLSTSAPAIDRTEQTLGALQYGSWGFDTAGADTAVKPGDDFYLFANGAWMRGAVIPADRIRVGPFANLRNLGEERVQALLDTVARANLPLETSAGKVGALYRSFMDEPAIEARGARPVRTALNRVRAVTTREELAALMGGALQGFEASVFDLDIAYDAKQPTRYAIYLNQGGLGLPERDYYLQPQFASQKAAYEAYAAQLLALVGWRDAPSKASSLVAFETQIAEVSWTHAAIRDPTTTYHPTSVAALERTAPGFAWRRFLDQAHVGASTRLVVTTDTSVTKIAAIYARTPLATLRAWEVFRTLDSAAPYLSKAFAEAQFDFRSRILAGQPEMPSRAKRSVATVNDALGAAVGTLYVEQYSSPESEAQVKALADNLKAALHTRIEALTWMGEDTKTEALRKLANLEIQIGHPKDGRDYRGLQINDHDLFGNIVRSRVFDWERRVHNLHKPWDKSDWRFWPQYPTAYTENNQLIFTAGMLQPPFFDTKADPAINYGSLGSVIGHELTHSFDDQGRQTDAENRLRDWWTPADAAAFQKRAQRLSVQYSSMEPLPGLHIKGDVTLGENIADLGGLTIALTAYRISLHDGPAPVIEGYTGEQRVFLGWAQIWREKIRDDALRRMVVSDVHSPSIDRVDGVVRNMDAWYAAFDVIRGETLFLEPSDRVDIW